MIGFIDTWFMIICFLTMFLVSVGFVWVFFIGGRILFKWMKGFKHGNG